MPCQKKYTAPEVTEQATKLIDQEWEEQVLKRLPAETEEQAFRLRAFVRCRAIKSVGDILRALLAYVLCVHSFRQLGSWAVLIGLANISEAAWRKRLKQANAWLLWPLSSMVGRSPGSGTAKNKLCTGTHHLGRWHPPQTGRWHR